MSGADTDRVGPVDHVTRPPLPWRTDAHVTECGKPLDQLVARVQELGQKRAAYSTCMTCWETASRHRSDRRDLVRTLRREIEALRYVPLGFIAEPATKACTLDQRRRRLDSELEALGALVDAHREEFDGYLAGKAQTASLADRRRSRAARPRPTTVHQL